MDTRTETQGGTPKDQQHHGRVKEGDPVIQTQNLAKVYRGGISAVDGLDLSVCRHFGATRSAHDKPCCAPRPRRLPLR